ncbi:flagellar hook-associated protein FlgL [Priestia filamentosa]|uniref:Flagellar hook-associated protein 3 n=1 Tax=Priestia filamentosa TaxID=1402861 RepID=A0A1X7FRE9_9BACI|nr:flagellar hook-associated protein FlgL [Priestia filamentosa]AKO94718.1 flagellar hook-associated protein 3 [Priestia filamentosa]MDT3765034.1 flagellar hook-associated protein FlgL [Priestia filamentosa]OXS66744.1 flagellar hook-associated protein FlgL [Priestia filamentosa]RJS66172.1 flagellar hook-associated protein FlgL [Priestia filamentosa]WCM15621.1 flagellar hook-associated protein FlgL [Priestia filamentosa]
MRVTQSMISQHTLRNMSSSYEKLMNLQEQATSGKKLNRPSDDPISAVKSLNYRTNLNENNQYKENFTEAYKWLDNSDGSLEEANKVMQRIRELTVSASNGTKLEDEREAIRLEVSGLKEHLVSIANKNIEGKFLFNGINTGQAPVDNKSGTIVVGASEKPISIELSKGLSIDVSTDGTDVFSQAFFDNLTKLEQSLAEGSSGEEIGDQLSAMDENINAIISARTLIGARTNRLEIMEARLNEQGELLEKKLSDVEDIDFEKAIMDLQMQETVQRAALAVGAKIMQPSLVDFLA